METNTEMRISEATRPLWVGAGPSGWGDVVQVVGPMARTARDVIAASGLSWRVEQHPVEAVIERGDAPTTRTRVPRAVANVRSDTGAVLGVVGEGYTPLQNSEAFGFADALIDSGNAHWVGAGSTRGGGRIHALMRLDREIQIGGAEGEDVLPLLLLRNGHDGGLAVTVSVSPFRLVCLNGMLLPIEAAARTWKARHTANITTKLADARRTLEIAWRYYDGLAQLGARLLAERLDAAGFDRFLTRLVQPPEPPPTDLAHARATRRAEAVREAIRTTYLATPDLANVRGTRWGALQAVTAYHDHAMRPRRTVGRTPTEDRFERATEPARLKDRALEILSA